MVTVEQILNVLKQEQVQFAVEALRKPAQGTAFEYGHRAGTVIGIEHSINKILNMLKDEEEREDGE